MPLSQRVVAVAGKQVFSFSCLTVIVWGHCTDDHCLSIPFLTLRWPVTPFRDWKVKVTWPLNAVTISQPYLWNGKVDELQTWYGWSMKEMCYVMCYVITDVTNVHDDQAKSSGWLFTTPLAGGRGHIVAAALLATQLVLICQTHW